MARLDEFANANPRRNGKAGRMDALPEDVKAQILASSAPHTATAEWLEAEGHAGIRGTHVGHWRRMHGWQQ